MSIRAWLGKPVFKASRNSFYQGENILSLDNFAPLDQVLSDRYFKRLGKLVGRAIGDFGMVRDGDSILVALSGGKDSLAVVDFLIEKQRRSPVKFSLKAFHVAMNKGIAEGLEKFARSRGIGFEVDYDALAGVDFSRRKNRCFLCSWNRRKAIFLAAKRNMCKVVAFGHNMDDIAQTALMNMCFQSSISAMSPKQFLFGGEITIIRPLAYLRDYELSALADKFCYPIAKRCEYENDNKRQMVKDFIAVLERDNPKINVAKNIFLSLNNINYEYLPKKIEG